MTAGVSIYPLTLLRENTGRSRRDARLIAAEHVLIIAKLESGFLNESLETLITPVFRAFFQDGIMMAQKWHSKWQGSRR